MSSDDLTCPLNISHLLPFHILNPNPRASCQVDVRWLEDLNLSHCLYYYQTSCTTLSLLSGGCQMVRGPESVKVGPQLVCSARQCQCSLWRHHANGWFLDTHPATVRIMRTVGFIPETRTPHPESRIPKPDTQNPKPTTLRERSWTRS